MFSIKTFKKKKKDRAEEVLMGLQDGSIQEKNLSYVHENSKEFGKKFDESYDRAYMKKKFFDILTNELGLSQDEIEELDYKWDDDYDTLNDIVLKLLDEKPLERMEQLQVAYCLCDKLENRW